VMQLFRDLILRLGERLGVDAAIGNQRPRWKVTATGPFSKRVSRLTSWPLSSGKTKEGIGSPGLGGFSPTSCALSRATN
jgi:hypothetical protein